MKWFCARWWWGVRLSVFWVPYCLVASATPITLEPPKPGSPIQDVARLITESDSVAIRAACTRLSAEQDTPLVVVTIDSMADSGWPRGGIASFARTLFEQWGQDPDFEFSESWRRGILLLVSKGDRKVRIELGAEWAGQYDEQCQRIMDQIIIPAFNEGSYSNGIYRGVSGLEAMSRGEELPSLFIGGLLEFFKIISIIPIISGLLITGIYVGDWVEKKLHPVAYAERMEALRLEEARAATRRKRRRRKKGRDDDEDYDSALGSDSGASYGGGGGATGAW